MSLLPKSLSGKSSDSGGSNCGGSGNNSDNSALISIGNTSFGFNFDSEEGTMNNSPRNSNSNSEEGDSDEGPGNRGKASGAKKPPASTAPVQSHQQRSTPAKVSSGSETSSTNMSSHNDAAAEAVASLQSIANETNKAAENGTYRTDLFSSFASNHLRHILIQNLCKPLFVCNPDSAKHGSKRKAQESVDGDSGSGGYNSDDETKLHGSRDETASRSADSDAGSGAPKGPRRKKRLDDMKREERNAREKERSFRISRQINELRNLLSSGGVIVPKGTKSSVLTEAANYIRMLQQHQYRSEM